MVKYKGMTSNTAIVCLIDPFLTTGGLLCAQSSSLSSSSSSSPTSARLWFILSAWNAQQKAIDVFFPWEREMRQFPGIQEFKTDKSTNPGLLQLPSSIPLRKSQALRKEESPNREESEDFRDPMRSQCQRNKQILNEKNTAPRTL